MERDDVIDRYEIMPGLVEVTLTPMGAGSVRGESVRSRASERKPLSAETRTASGIEVEVEAILWRLYVGAFSSPVETIRNQALITEDDGTQWIVVSAGLRMMRTRWDCVCVRNFESPD